MGTPYEDVRQNYIGAWPRVLRAVEWAARHGIGILIDLHGAPGSQNGQHHSGVLDEQTGLFSSPENVQKTILVLKFLTETFINVPNVVGIQLLNEPIDSPETFDFYNVALDSLRGMDLTGIKSFPFYIHDAFNLQRGADLIRSRGAEWNVLDHHSYYVFTAYDSSRSASAHTADLGPTGVVGSELRDVGQSLNGNLITGEWSCALSEDSLKMESDPISARRQFCEVQEQAYQKSGSGSFFWSFKKENCEEDPSWCFQSAVGKSLPVSFFAFEGLTVPKNLDSIVSGGTVLSQSDDRKGPASRPPSKKTIRQVSALASSRPRNRTVPRAALSASAQSGARSPSNVSALSRSRNIPDTMSFFGGVRLRHGSRPALHRRGSSIHQRRMDHAGSPAHRRTDTTEPAISADAGRDISPPASGPPSTVSSGSESPVIDMPPSSDVA
ncbi:Glucan 1,3-beta-glucosidase 3, partial [Serendipita sp. 401]